MDVSSGKRYFWLKLKEDFFGSKRIKKLRNMAGGDTYLIIYLKLQLKAMKTDGIIQFDHLEDNIMDELALDLDEKPDDVAATLIYLTHCGLAETSDQETFYFPYAVENVGSENSSAARVREYRKKQKALHCNTNETPVKRLCNGEIEKEIEIEKEQEEVGGDDTFGMDPDEAQRIARDHSEILDAAEAAGFPKNPATWDKIIALYAEFGKETVLAGISACVEQTVIKPAYLRKCCQNIASGEKKEDADPLLPRDHVFMGW
jgi:predicted phage replisome organizer